MSEFHFLRRWAVLLCPPLYVSLPPYAALREFCRWLGEALDARKLVGALLRHGEHLANFGGSYELHVTEVIA